MEIKCYVIYLRCEEIGTRSCSSSKTQKHPVPRDVYQKYRKTVGGFFIEKENSGQFDIFVKKTCDEFFSLIVSD